MVKVKEKRCSMCGILKPAEKMVKDRSSKDGLSSRCKLCWTAYNVRLQGHKEPRGKPRIETWEQVEDMLRAMAETQLSIQTEEANFNIRISKIEEAFTETVEAWTCQLAGQQIMIADFLKRDSKPGKPVTRQCDFGKIFFGKGKIEIKLNPDVARERWGRP